MYLNVAGQHIIVLNTAKAAADLFDRRADNYSDRRVVSCNDYSHATIICTDVYLRPVFIVASDMLCGGILLVFMRFDDL